MASRTPAASGPRERVAGVLSMGCLRCRSSGARPRTIAHPRTACRISRHGDTESILPLGGTGVLQSHAEAANEHQAPAPGLGVLEVGGRRRVRPLARVEGLPVV